MDCITPSRLNPNYRTPGSPGTHGAGQKFQYTHPKDCPGHFIAQDYLGVDKTFYEPTEQGEEKQVKAQVENWRKQFQEVRRQATEPAVNGKTGTLGKCSDCRFAIPAYKEDFECSCKTKMLSNKGLNQISVARVLSQNARVGVAHGISSVR